MSIKFEWNPRKARSNVRKHGIDFDGATTVFADLLSITIPDPDHSKNEERWVIMGLSNRQRLLVVVHTEEAETIRIISVRRAEAYGGQTALSGGNMKKGTRKDNEMRKRYDFTGGVRGKYAHRYAEGTNVVVLDPDVAQFFPNRQTVNETLRAVAQIAQIQDRTQGRTSKALARRRQATGRKERNRSRSSGSR